MALIIFNYNRNIYNPNLVSPAQVAAELTPSSHGSSTSLDAADYYNALSAEAADVIHDTSSYEDSFEEQEERLEDEEEGYFTSRELLDYEPSLPPELEADYVPSLPPELQALSQVAEDYHLEDAERVSSLSHSLNSSCGAHVHNGGMLPIFSMVRLDC